MDTEQDNQETNYLDYKLQMKEYLRKVEALEKIPREQQAGSKEKEELDNDPVSQSLFDESGTFVTVESPMLDLEPIEPCEASSKMSKTDTETTE